MQDNYEGMSDTEKVQALRREAEFLEHKGKIKNRLIQLMKISKDPYYDQYLNQLLKDLESGKATPGQVNAETERTFKLYNQRLGQEVPVPAQNKSLHTDDVCIPQYRQTMENKARHNMEFNIGAGVFSLVGVLFVLVSFITFGLNFLNGILQGICLYAVSVIVLCVSELLIKRKSPKFSLAITGLGICSLYVSTIINYLYLKTINGMAAMCITLAIAVAAILFSRKKDSTIIRIISFAGSYLCFFPIRGFNNEWEFMVITVIILTINMVCAFYQNQKNNGLINMVHMAVNTLFTIILSAVAIHYNIQVMYIILFAIASVIFLNTAYIRQSDNPDYLQKILYAIELGICGFIIFYVSWYAQNKAMVGGEWQLNLLYRLVTEALLIVVCLLFYLVNSKNSMRWAQYFAAAGTIAFIGTVSPYEAETVFTFLSIFIVTRLFSKFKELKIFDCIISVITGILLFTVNFEWYFWIIAAVLIISVLFIRNMVIFHEINITVCFALTCFIQLYNWKWNVVAAAIILLTLFIAFNHLPWTKKINQLPNNIVNISVTAFFYLFSFLNRSVLISSVMMCIGTVAILIMFRERYLLNFKKKYLILAGFLVYMIVTTRFKSPVIISVLLMLVAFGCIGVGFKFKDKIQRICGLTVALLVCIKLVLYDFRGLDSLPKTILFLVVGIIALSISFVYIQLEKKQNKIQIQNV